MRNYAPKARRRPLEEVQTQLIDRDQRDSTREIAPLRCAEDAIVINSSNLSVAQVVERLIRKIHKRFRQGSGT